MLRIKQIYYPAGNLDQVSFEGDWSNNLIDKQVCYSINIHSLPGNKFQINDVNEIIINSTGNFAMDFNYYPIESLRMYKNNNYQTYQTVIDIVYQQYEEEG